MNSSPEKTNNPNSGEEVRKLVCTSLQRGEISFLESDNLYVERVLLVSQELTLALHKFLMRYRNDASALRRAHKHLEIYEDTSLDELKVQAQDFEKEVQKLLKSLEAIDFSYDYFLRHMVDAVRLHHPFSTDLFR